MSVGTPTAATADEAGFITLTVAAVDPDTVVTGVVESVRVTFDTGAHDIPFQHGQHLTLRREFDGVEVRRSYSICSPAPDGPLRVAIKRVPGGIFSSWATTELRPGDRLDVLPPSGHFTHGLDPDTARRYTLLAAGSGITPVLSIMATVLDREPAARVTLLYLNRSSLSTMLLDELHDLRDRHLGRPHRQLRVHA